MEQLKYTQEVKKREANACNLVSCDNKTFNNPQLSKIQKINF